MNKIHSTLAMLAMMVAALSFAACSSDDDSNDNGSGNASTSLTLNALKGTWTTVGLSEVPIETDKPRLANVSFMIEYDDGEFGLWSAEWALWTLDISGSAIVQSGETVFDVERFSTDQLVISIPKFSNAVVTMKKLGTLNDEDYRFKLCNGAWLFGVSGDGSYASYLALSDDTNLLQECRRCEDGATLFRFHADGTGECAHIVRYTNGTLSYYDEFRWQLDDKAITLWYDNQQERQSPIRFVGIEGEVLLKYTYRIWK